MPEDNKFKKVDQYKESPNLDAELANKTNAQLEAEIIALDLEAKRMDIAYKKQEMEWRAKNIKSMDREQTKADAAFSAKMQEARDKMVATLQFLASRKASQDHCTHRKGGSGPIAVMHGQGTANEYSVIRHLLPCNEYLVLCQRCGKEWLPPNKWNVENGIIKPTEGTPGWKEAMQYPTDNSPSQSGRWLYEKVEL